MRRAKHNAASDIGIIGTPTEDYRVAVTAFVALRLHSILIVGRLPWRETLHYSMLRPY